MSRQDYTPDLSTALDRFDVFAPREGFADRIMTAATMPTSRPALRDRRGGWKLARRAIIGTVAAGLVSAAAVASGLLGAAGIRVPVLTAMLASQPEAVPVPKIKTKPIRIAPAPKPPVVSTNSVDPDPVLIQSDMSARQARVAERRARRREFTRQNPELRPVIRQALKNRQDFVRANPDVRELRRMPIADRKAYLADRPELREALRARQAERRAFRAADPQAEAIIRARIEQRSAANKAAAVDTGIEGNPELPR